MEHRFIILFSYRLFVVKSHFVFYLLKFRHAYSEEFFEAFAKIADGKATKIIIPSNIQSLAGLASSMSELVKEDK